MGNGKEKRKKFFRQKKSPFPGWDLVYDGFSSQYFYEHPETGKISFASPDVDPDGIKTDTEIQICEDEKLAKRLAFEDVADTNNEFESNDDDEPTNNNDNKQK